MGSFLFSGGSIGLVPIVRVQPSLHKSREKTTSNNQVIGMRQTPFGVHVFFLLAVGLSACGGGGGGSAPPARSVTLAWGASHESGVNRAGGGYQVSIGGQPTIDVPYTSGSAAPTSTAVWLQPGSYTVSVRAYAALDAQGGNTGSLSAPSQSLTVNVP